MHTATILSLAWVGGYLLVYWMLRVEHTASKETFTKGDQVFSYLFSVLSWVLVFYILMKTWVQSIGNDYWNKPAAPGPEPVKTKSN